VAKASLWTTPDTEARKLGEQTGLDTLVVLAVNGAYLLYKESTPFVAKHTR
jgi:hypothetical protein